MDAREKWLKQAMQLASIFLFEGRRNDDATPMLKQAGDNLQAHLRTTPEGFALVPVPEWVRFSERLPVVKAGELYSPIWITRQLEVPDESLQEVLSDYFYPRDIEWWNTTYKHGFTHWSYRYVEPAPKAPPPKSESL